MVSLHQSSEYNDQSTDTSSQALMKAGNGLVVMTLATQYFVHRGPWAAVRRQDELLGQPLNGMIV